MKLKKGLLAYVAMLNFVLFIGTAYGQDDIQGAWTADFDGIKAVCIVVKDYYAIAYYSPSDHAYQGTEGGSWSSTGDDMVTILPEFNTESPDQIGVKQDIPVTLNGDNLIIDGQTWDMVDNGGPGALAGAWLITGRKRDGEIQPMQRGPRKTMKILSGTRFQWIAYNVDTKEFRGTGGGTYTTEDGKYVETIDFFSRDNDRVGAVLPFDYELKDGDWHHSGKSSKGDPIYEVWSLRTEE